MVTSLSESSIIENDSHLDESEAIRPQRIPRYELSNYTFPAFAFSILMAFPNGLLFDFICAFYHSS